jgi:hypothetical protein
MRCGVTVPRPSVTADRRWDGRPDSTIQRLKTRSLESRLEELQSSADELFVILEDATVSGIGA